MAETDATGDPDTGSEYQFRLFVSGTTPRSLRAVSVVRGLCEEFLAGRYTLEITDVFDCPEAAKAEQVVAVPTLIMKAPVPRQIFVGDMSDTARLLAGLGLTNSD